MGYKPKKCVISRSGVFKVGVFLSLHFFSFLRQKVSVHSVEDGRAADEKNLGPWISM